MASAEPARSSTLALFSQSWWKRRTSLSSGAEPVAVAHQGGEHAPGFDRS